MNGGPQKSVLVVEDDEDMVFLMTVILEDEGYRVAAAGNGRDALLLLAEEMPDLILLDMNMPVMGGAEFVRRLAGRHAPIVVVTAADDARRRAAEIRADGWLGKPFDPAELVAAVRRFVGAAREPALPPTP